MEDLSLATWSEWTPWNGPPKSVEASKWVYRMCFWGLTSPPTKPHFAKAKLPRPKLIPTGTLNIFWDKISLQGKIRRIFPPKDNVPLKIVFPFPQNRLFSQEIKGLGKTSFMPSGKIYGLPSRGKIYLKHFFASENVWEHYRKRQLGSA